MGFLRCMEPVVIQQRDLLIKVNSEKRNLSPEINPLTAVGIGLFTKSRNGLGLCQPKGMSSNTTNKDISCCISCSLMPYYIT